MQSDEELISEIKRGSRSALEVLIRRHYKFVFGIVYRKTGEYHVACDLTQEVFIKVAKSVSSYKGEGKFKSWLIPLPTTTVHWLFTHMREFSNGELFRTYVAPLCTKPAEVRQGFVERKM